MSQGNYDSETIVSAAPIAILSPVEPSPQLQLLLFHPTNASKVQYFVGWCTSAESLRRVKARSAVAIFLFVDSSVSDNVIKYNETEDYITRLKALSVVNFIKVKLDAEYRTALESNEISTILQRPVIISQALWHDTCFSLLDSGVDRAISLNTTKYYILAYGSMFPGFIGLISHLTISTKHSKRNKTMHEFDYGLVFELVEIPIDLHCSENIKRLSFSQLCRLLYLWSGGVIACVGIFDHQDQGTVILNPHKHCKIGDCYSLFVICNNVDLVVSMLSAQEIIHVIKRFIPSGKNSSSLKRLLQDSVSLSTPSPRVIKKKFSHNLSDVPDMMTFRRDRTNSMKPESEMITDNSHRESAPHKINNLRKVNDTIDEGNSSGSISKFSSEDDAMDDENDGSVAMTFVRHRSSFVVPAHGAQSQFGPLGLEDEAAFELLRAKSDPYLIQENFSSNISNSHNEAGTDDKKSWLDALHRFHLPEKKRDIGNGHSTDHIDPIKKNRSLSRCDSHSSISDPNSITEEVDGRMTRSQSFSGLSQSGKVDNDPSRHQSDNRSIIQQAKLNQYDNYDESAYVDHGNKLF